ncbi:MAG: zinc ribbon domain-containing protein [Methanoregula sp.]|jgi:hypothetical protein|uniref:zinc ribbon domain-containing protein n=1 Tax=Methanoregula sp. TaxID=2052170 RepID=UPI0025D7D382|nr:zinc-ribbon domain-containing protein [Methanoregula sp.]MCK9631972.1 zinc ribbon domain-containing protein [Methanoregula sp.]
MAYPDLYSDETVVLNAQNIKVKSVSFDAVLTTRRLILVDSKKHLIAPQEILLATLRDIEVGENAIRDPTLTLSIITNTGATRQMILTFSKTSGGDRRRECDEWVKVLRHQIAAGVQHPIMPDVPEHEAYPAEQEHFSARVEATNVPVAPTPKKKIEIARPGPMKKIVEPAPYMPAPVETTSLPTGSFCNRCGSRVPPGSAFCNKCGTPVVTEAELDARLAGAAEPQSPVAPQVQMHVPAYVAGNEKKERPIEDVIHSIEPLIEDSVPRNQPYPLVPKQQYQPAVHAEEPGAAPGQDAPAPDTAELAMPEVKWPVLGSAAIPPDAPGAAAESPQAPPPVPQAAPRSKKPILIGVIAIVIIAIIAAVFIFANPLGGGTAAPEVTPAPVVTTVTTTVPATTKVTVVKTTAVPESTTAATSGSQMAVPASGVWVHILYVNEFKGTAGTAGNQAEIYGAGEKFYQIPTSEGVVVVSIQKLDGSSEKLTVEVYKDGEMISSKSSTVPKGFVEVMTDLKPSPTPTPTPTHTKIPVPVKTTAATNSSASNTTANETATE